MLKVLKNLKKSWLSVLVIVLLLGVQAMTDLALPDYTSKIVNNGIQAGGIENPAPEVIRKTQMESLLDKYTLISKRNSKKEDYEKNVKKYPELEKQDLYIQNKLNKEEQDNINELITKPMLMLYNLENEETANMMKSKIFEDVPQEKIEANISNARQYIRAINNFSSKKRISRNRNKRR